MNEPIDTHPTALPDDVELSEEELGFVTGGLDTGWRPDLTVEDRL